MFIGRLTRLTRLSSRAAIVAAAAVLATMIAGGPDVGAQRAVAPADASPRHVVIISIDGLKPKTYTTPGPSKIPTLRRLAQEGAYADGVIGVTPTVTYPSHTTMITGVLPAVHGIPNNLILDPEGRSNGEWYRYARDIKAPTLPGVVKARGLTTAAVFWPVSVGMDADYVLPEFGFYLHPKMLEMMRVVSTPRHLIDAYEIASGKPLPWPMTDDDRTGVAAWIMRAYRPHLLLLHIFGTDDAQHRNGPDTPEALASIEAADGHVKQMLDAIKDAGLESNTDVVIVSDHGFLPLKQQLQLNYAFKQEGLLQVDPATNRISTWDAYFYGAGGSGFVILKNPDDEALRQRVAALLKKVAADPANGILTVADRDAVRKAGADPRASFWIDMKDGFYTNSAHDALVKPATSKGGHGFAPTRPDLHASLILRGPDVPKAGSLGIVRMTQLAPTVAGWFGVSLSPQVDAPLALGAQASPSR